MKTIIYIFVILLLQFGISGAGIIDPNINDKKYIDYAKNYDCVAQILVSYKDSSVGEASCVILNKNWVITSAHVVNNSKLCFIKINEKAYILSKIIIHKDFDDKKIKADIALCYSSTSLEIDNYPELYKKDDELNKLCSICGHGQTGNFLTGVTKHDQYKRAGKNIIKSILDNELLVFPLSREKRTDLDFGITRGDSGGGLFIDGKLAGINCCVLARDRKTDSDYDDECCFMRISKYYTWIDSNVNYLPGSE